MSEDYYDELDQPGVAQWARVGWRHRIEQAYRFEAALELVRAYDGPVLDVGAGLGGLAEYAADCGVEREWIAIEPRPSFAASIRAAGTYDRVFESPFHAVQMPAVGCAVAVGVLTSTTSASRAELSAFMARAPASMYTVLDREALSKRPILFAEHASAAATWKELCDAGEGAVWITSTDFAVYRPGSFAPRSVAERFRAACAGPWGNEPASVVAWLACELGLDAQAEEWLARADDGAFAEAVRARLRFSLASDGGGRP